MVSYERVYGVDFSVSRQRAGKQLWIARGTIEDRQLKIERVRCAFDWFEANPTHRDETLNEIVEFIASQTGDSAFGLDFPFGVPESVFSGDWEGYVRAFPTNLGCDIQSPDDLYEVSKKEVDGESMLARATDQDNDARPCVGWFMRHLTYHGIHRVLQPLVERKAASIHPMRPLSEDVPTVLEIYPAATLRQQGLEPDGYKDVHEKSRRKRKKNVEGLRADSVSIAEEVRKRAICNHDALDSIIAAIATFENLGNSGRRDTPYDREGYIFT